MGVVYGTGQSVYDMFDEDDAKCFYCRQGVSAPYLFWMHGPDQHLRLHPNCFVDLTTRLFRDYHEIQCKTDSLTGL